MNEFPEPEQVPNLGIANSIISSRHPLYSNGYIAPLTAHQQKSLIKEYHPEGPRPWSLTKDEREFEMILEKTRGRKS